MQKWDKGRKRMGRLDGSERSGQVLAPIMMLLAPAEI